MLVSGNETIEDHITGLRVLVKALGLRVRGLEFRIRGLGGQGSSLLRFLNQRPEFPITGSDWSRCPVKQGALQPVRGDSNVLNGWWDLVTKVLDPVPNYTYKYLQAVLMKVLPCQVPRSSK